MYVIHFDTIFSWSFVLFQFEDYYMEGISTEWVLLLNTVARFTYCFTSNLLRPGASPWLQVLIVLTKSSTIQKYSYYVLGQMITTYTIVDEHGNVARVKKSTSQIDAWIVLIIITLLAIQYT